MTSSFRRLKEGSQAKAVAGASSSLGEAPPPRHKIHGTLTPCPQNSLQRRGILTEFGIF
jgi:hypothetical protein